MAPAHCVEPFKEYLKCDLCGCGNFATLFYKQTDNSRILKCGNCGLVFVYPQLINQGMNSHYQNDAVVSEKDLSRFKKRTNHLDSAIGKTILSTFYGYPKPNEKISFFGRVIAFLSLPFIDRNIIPYKGEGRILDIGCGAGLYLSLLKSIGWQAYGVELNRFACDYAGKMGIKVFCGELEKANFPSGFFDRIRFTHVLEHVSSPSKTLAEISRILKSGGSLYLETPNQKSFAAQRFREKWLKADEHLYAFSSQTLSSILRKCGFSVARKIRYKSSKGIAASSFKCLWKNWLGDSLSEALVKNKFFYACIIRPFYGFLNLIRSGDTIIAEAAKETG